MPSKGCTMKREVGINIKHSAIVISHQAQSIVTHRMGYTRRVNPVRYFSPNMRIIVQCPCYLKEWNIGSLEYAGNFGYWAGRAVSKPFARHLRAVFEAVKLLVVNRCFWRQIQNNYGYFG